jgi:hypothetical protein
MTRGRCRCATKEILVAALNGTTPANGCPVHDVERDDSDDGTVIARYGSRTAAMRALIVDALDEAERAAQPRPSAPPLNASPDEWRKWLGIPPPAKEDT